jgi:hypothetical protein
VRWYEIDIYDQDFKLVKTYSSVNPDESNNRGALQMEADLPVYYLAQPGGGGSLRIWGIPLKEISSAALFEGGFIYIYGGSNKGLPLENPGKSGLLYTGRIFQCFGNWQDTMQSLEFVLIA